MMGRSHNARSLTAFAKRRAVLFVLLAFLGTLPLLALSPIPVIPHKHDNHRQIERLEEVWRAAILVGDTDAVARLLADDYIGITANGTLQTREQAIENLRSSPFHLTAMEISDRKIRFYGKTAVVTSLAQVEGTSPEGAVSGESRYTRVYVRNPQGEWKIVSFEVSKIRPVGTHH
jgi:ketosteroid isomerase-like protein